MKLQAEIKFMKIIDLDEMKIDTEHPIINTQAEIDSSSDDFQHSVESTVVNCYLSLLPDLGLGLVCH